MQPGELAAPAPVMLNRRESRLARWGALASQRQWWINACSDKQMELLWRMLDEKSQRCMNRFTGDKVIVIQNQGGVLRKRRQFVDEWSQSASQQRGLW